MMTWAVFLVFAIVCVSLICAIDLNKNLLKTWKNNSFYAFRGIKYAESPTGPLRFKAPQPANTWNNLSAIFEQPLTEDGSDCPSPGNSYYEDCLFLNVYTKSLNETSLKPVIVFIHPGGFYVGSGSSANYGPEYLLEEDVVLVTFNYRLAFFGFTSVGSDDAIGNAGYKDQALVLQWVHDHIRHFGGDPDCVTLMGDSAGAMSVQLHLVSPLSRHLFHRAFVMSGGVPQAKSPSSQPHLVAKLARLIGCPEVNSFDCIKRTDTATITNSLRKIFDFGWDNPVYPWLPIVEPKSNEVPFMDKDPIRLLETGKFNAIPIMVSMTKDETTASAMYLFEHKELLTEWLNDFSRVAPICMQYDANDTVTKALKQRYAAYDINDRKRYLNLFIDSAQSFTDSTIVFPLYRFVQIVKYATDVYYLKFNYRGSYSSAQCNSTIDKDFCDDIKTLNIVEHCDDLQYLFTSTAIPRITDESSTEGQFVVKYTKLLHNFAKKGYPYFDENLSAINARFNDNEAFVHFGTETTADFHLDNYPFKDAHLWDSLFPMNTNKEQ